VTVADAGFVHLHVHSSYSLLEGALPIARLAELAKADRQPALALTDTDNMFGVLEFSDKMAAVGIQPIIGCALAVDFGDHDQSSRAAVPAAHKRALPRLVLLAASEDGYRNLMRLCSRAFLETASGEAPHVELRWLDDTAAGLIALTGGASGALDTAIVAGQSHLAASRCEALLSLFGDRLYIELQRHGAMEQRTTEPQLVDIAYSKGILLCACR
jgi:DNA polymerase III subunit alpha